MKRAAVRIVLALVAVVVVVWLLRTTVFESETVPVTVFRAARGLVESTVTNSKSGSVETRRRALLSPEISGRVERIFVREGDRVRAGDVLLRLAGADYRAQVALRERTVEAARAAEREACLSASQAVRNYERIRRLADDELVSAEMLEAYESRRDVSAAGCEAAGARVQEAESALELARVQLSRTVIRAPFGGVVAEVAAELGEWITPSPPGVPIPAVVELIENEAIYISAPLDEVDLDKVAVDQPVRVTIDAYPGRALAGRVTRVAPYVVDLEEHSRTFEIEVELDDADFAGGLLPGTSADVEVILESQPDVLRIPSYALIEGSRVLVVQDDELVAREVETALRNWDFVQITDGLEADERVVVSVDRAEVKEGARVRVAGETLK